MRSAHARTIALRPWFEEKFLLGLTPAAYAKSLMRPADVVFGLILLIGIPLIVYRFAFGLAATTNLTQDTPWGLWIGFDMLSGVALAAGGYTIATTVHIFGLKAYEPIVRPAVLTGFLGYLFAVIGLCMDLGRPWNLPMPMIFPIATTSVMFEVAWCVGLYTTVLFLEFSPAMFEWLGWDTWRARVLRLALAGTVLGTVLSTLHQSSLGALFMLAPTKLHPLWYSVYTPTFFFVSSIAAGLGMVIVESGLAHRMFHHRLDPTRHVDIDALTIGLARAAAIVLFSYFFLRLQGLADGGHWHLLATPYGGWYLVEVVGFVLLPSLVFAFAARHANVRLVRWTAAWTVLGIVVGRLNVSVIAMNWTAAQRYVPSWMEVMISITIITMGVLVYRFIVNRMPILGELPEYRGSSH